VNVCSAIVSIPARELVVVFVVTEKLTCPLPVPLLPAVMLAQLTPVVADQLQLLGEAVTVTAPVPPFAGKEALDGETPKLHTWGEGPGVVG
jgi:hypothetical protein